MQHLIEQFAITVAIPILCYGILSGFALGTVLHLLSYGIFKAISLVNIKNVR